MVRAHTLWRSILPLPFRWILLALGVRVLLSPLQHTWDSQTWWNVAAQLGADGDLVRAVAAPYETMRALSYWARGSGLKEFYEYWAYPPGMLVVWWPVARAWMLVAGPLPQQFWGPDAFTAFPVPFALSLGMKVPVMLADIAIGLLLARVASPSVGRWYLFNPYSLLAGLWTFDAVMVALLLGGLLAGQRQRWALAGTLLGLGATVKFVPALFVPVVALWALRVAPRPWKASLTAVVAAAATFLAVCLPWLDGLRFVLEFHAARAGGGMAWQNVWGTVAWLDPTRDLGPVHLYLSAQIGNLTLGTALVLTTWLVWLRRLELFEAALAIMLAYLAGSKLVNEVYALPAVALLAIVLERRFLPGGRYLLRILWAAPLLYTLVNVPWWGFFLAPLGVLGLVSVSDAQVYHDSYLLTYQYLAPVLTAVGVLFQGACAWGIWMLVGRGGVGALRNALAQMLAVPETVRSARTASPAGER